MQYGYGGKIITPTNKMMNKYFLITKSTYHPTNKKPHLESIKLRLDYETDALSSILNYLEDEWTSI